MLSLAKSLGSKVLSPFTKSLNSNNLNGANNLLIEQIRPRISCSSKDGREKSVKTAMERYFRIDKRFWIKMLPGYRHHLYLKPMEKVFLVQQPVIVGKKESLMLERMAGKYYKKIKLDRFVDPPFVHYHQFLKPKRELI